MNNLMLVPQASELEEFINFLFDGLEGYMYVAAKGPDHVAECTPKKCKCWDQVFFEYPAQAHIAVRQINKFSPTHEIYMAPALYKNKGTAEKTDVKYSQVLWCDFDGNTPNQFDIPPSLIVRTSEPGHEHAYWKLDAPLDSVDTIEEYNRRLCFKYGADASGWNANKVLRPPYTVNHKRNGLPVSILNRENGLTFTLEVFDDLAPAPEKTVDYSLWQKLDLPDLSDIIYSHKFGPDFRNLFEKQKNEISDRSVSLTNMAYICAEAGLNDKEIYVILDHLATRWEKFAHHTPDSRAKNLIGIIEHTRIKYPHSNYSDFDQVFVYSPRTLLETDIQIEWAIEGMLMKSGVMLFSGRSGIGKTQIAMQFMAHIAMGVPFLNYNINRSQKIGFFSLEMGDLEVKHFLQQMYPKWAEQYPDKIHLLNENLQIIPFGESLPLNTTQGQHIFLQYLENYKWDGIFVDSVGSAIFGNISSSETVQAFTNFNDKIRKRYGCFLWYVHHFRKAAQGTTQYGGLEDSFGDQYLTARATSVYTVTPAKEGLIRVRNPKNRHAKEQDPFLIKRVAGLTFEYKGIENETPDVLAQIIKEPPKNKLAPENDQSPKPFGD